jgi:hypothetical protein
MHVKQNTFPSLRLQTFPQLVGLKPLSIAVNALAAVGDVLIASALCWMLHRSRTGFQRWVSIAFYLCFGI